MSIDWAHLKKNWFIAAHASNLKYNKPLSIEIFDTPIVLFKTNHGLSALLDRCLHRNVRLSKGKIKNNCIQCPYHGWEFNERGEVTHIPGLTFKANIKKQVPTFAVQEHQGLIWICPTQNFMPNTPPPKIPYFKSSDFQSFWMDFELNGQLINILENFLDATHTHFVHPGLIRKDNQRQNIQAFVHTQERQVEVEYLDQSNQSGFISKYLEPARHKSFGRFIMPSIGQLEYRSKTNLNMLITGYITPSKENHHTIRTLITLPKSRLPLWLKKSVIKPLFKKAIKQDQKIIDEQEQQIKRFSGEDYVLSPLDLIRPYLVKLLNHIPLEHKSNTSSVTLEL